MSVDEDMAEFRAMVEYGEAHSVDTFVRHLAGDKQVLAWIVDNIYTIARRELRRVEDGKPLRPEMWAHVFRLCDKAGGQLRTVGVLRASDAVDPHAASQQRPSTREESSSASDPQEQP